MATPNRPPGGAPKTPGTLGFFRGLFGSTAKKPVETGTNDRRRSPVLPRLDFSPQRRSDAATALSPEDRIQQAAQESPPRASSEAMVATAPTSPPPPAKSPWKPSTMNGVRFSVGMASPQKNLQRMQRRGSNTPLTDSTVTRQTTRRGRYRGTSTMLQSSKLRHTRLFNTKKTLNPVMAQQVLRESRGIFQRETTDTDGPRNFASFQPGQRVLGAYQQRSRWPNQLPPPDDDELPIPAGKRRKRTVSFETDHVRTPVQRVVYKRQATPMPSSPMDASTDLSEDSSAKLPPLPVPKVYNADGPYIFDDEYPEPKEATGDMVSLFDLPYAPCDKVDVFKNASKLHGGTFTYDEVAYDASIREKTERKRQRLEEGQEDGPKGPKKRRYTTCEHCGAKVPDMEEVCQDCGKRPVVGQKSEGWGTLFANRPEQWKCSNCFAHNPADETKCRSCEAVRVPDAGGNTSASSTAATSTTGTSSAAPKGFTFGAPTGNAVSGASTTDAASKAPNFTFGAPTSGDAASKTPNFTFGAPTSGDDSSKAPNFTFGAPTSGDDSSKAPNFTFGAPTSGDAAAKSNFSFGFGTKANEPDASASKADTKPTPSFGDSPEKKMKSPAGAPDFSFSTKPAAGSETAPAVNTPASSGFAFGTSATAGTPSATPAPKLSFGTGKKADASPKKADSPKPFSFPTKTNANSSPKNSSPSVTPGGFAFGTVGKDKKPTEESKAEPEPKASPKLSFPMGKLPVPAGDKSPAPALFGMKNSEGSQGSASFAFGGSDNGNKAPAFKFNGDSFGKKRTGSPAATSTPSAPTTTQTSKSAPAAKRSRPIGDNEESANGATAAKPFSFSTPTASSSKDEPATAPLTFPVKFGSDKASAAPPTQTGTGNDSKTPFGSAAASTTPAASAGAFTFGTSAPSSAAPAPQGDENTKKRRNGDDAPSAQQTGLSTTAPSFGATPAPAPATSGFAFGTQSTKDTGAPLGTSNKSDPSTSFGATPSATNGSSSSAPLSANPFGSAPVGTAPAISFGKAAAAPAPPAGNPFGAPAAPAPATNPPFSFGSSESSKPAQAPAAQFSFGSNASSQAATPSQPSMSFGQSTSNSFSGSGANTAPAPPAATPGFPPFGNTAAGATPAAAAPMFGASTPAPAPGFFGSTPAPPAGNTGFAPSFGAPAPAAAPAGNSFGFGAAAPQTGFQSQPPAATPGFGGGFGAAQPGFGAGAQPTTPATMGAPSNVQFSIGTGGTGTGTIRGRRRIKAKRPTGSAQR